ncbi:hypothetical protein DY000_02036760 [Brassica cretica]|uniref:Uncharacterized protein n=1 Tax=Brassica cretica TaxID=69181 RepID=A0ABQ7BC11_BRACR|nr:hypothetical protein DY000_02036760 [Brassica cretica]
MAIIGDALRQAFTPKQEYESLREEEDRAWTKLRRPAVMSTVSFICFVVLLLIFFFVVSNTLTGGVRCLSILNVVFAIIYGLLAIFLGSSLLIQESSCSVPLFWCYEILVILYAGTAFFLRRRAALSIDEGEFGNRIHQGLEMLEANHSFEFTPDVERRVNEGV